MGLTVHLHAQVSAAGSCAIKPSCNGSEEFGDALMALSVMGKQGHLEVGPQSFNQTQQDGRQAEQVMLGEEEEDHLLGNVDNVDEDEAVEEHGKLILGEQEVLEAS